MPMSVICRSATGGKWMRHRGWPARSGGYTLIEITVVLILLAVVLGLAAPGLSRLYGRVVLRSNMQDLQNAIAGLPLVAYALGEEGTLAQLAAAHVQLPDDWSLQDADTIYLRATGLCSGGTLRIVTPQGPQSLLLEAPFCVPRAAP